MPFIVCEIISCEPIAGKPKLKKLSVNIGGVSNYFNRQLFSILFTACLKNKDDGPITVVSNAPNIRNGTRTVMATIGTEFENNETGEKDTVRKTAVGGVYSEGIICDSVMLNWVGGGAGVAVQVIASYGTKNLIMIY